MKKQLLALAVATAGFVNAQTFTMNFSGAVVPALPAGWMQNNVDGLTVSPVVFNNTGMTFGSNAWITRNMGGTYGNAAVSTSYYSPVNASDDWLISPSFTVPAGAYLDWEAAASDPQYPDGYEVRISTTGTTVTSFTSVPALFSIPAENTLPNFTNRVVSLNTYSTQVVNIAFRNTSNDKYLLYIDNIKCLVPPATDGAVMTINNLTRYMVGAGNQNIGGTFKTYGANTVTTAVLNYKVNNGAVTTQTMNFGNLTYAQTGSYAFSTPANIPLGTNKIKVWVSAVNGTPETNLLNDTVMTQVYVASVSKPRNALIEEFSSSTCAPCAALNVTQGFDALLNTNNANTGGDLNVIKNQVNWPSPGTDPSYNSFSAARVTYYGINAAPTTIANGTFAMSAHSQGEINTAKAVPALAEISASLSISAGSVVTGNATVTPYVSVSDAASPIRIHQVLLQKHYNYQGGTTIQKDYYHVMREMFPSASGSTVNLVDGTPQTVTFNKTIITAAPTASGSTNFWTETSQVYEYVVFVQDVVSDQILQSGSAFTSLSTGIVEFKNNSSIGVYPNPAKDFATVGIKLNNPSVVDITITDITGKVVYSNAGAQVNGSTNEITINTSEFATGTYNVMVKTNEGVLTDKLVVVK